MILPTRPLQEHFSQQFLLLSVMIFLTEVLTQPEDFLKYYKGYIQENAKCKQPMLNSAAQYESGRTRMEHDLLGERDVPFENYYGIQTLRAIENFNISGITLTFFHRL